ncbi:MAG: hypothetical protein HKO65_05555 [Gemmatimonadetes bacterium]|nr:hypothetical protein [Gemmatimonadota bacterium]
MNTRRPHPNAGPLFLLACLASFVTPSAGLNAQVPDTPSAPSLADLAFMSGCWNGSFQSHDGEGVIEEHYTSPSENVILGTTRYLLDGRAVQFELTTLRAGEDGVITMLPYPGGERSPDGFRLTRVIRTGEAVEAVFEAPEHDFPKRVIYRGDGDELVARIDGGEGSDQASTWEMRPVACFKK